MNSTFTYQWSEDLARSALNSYYSTQVAKPRSFIVGGVILVAMGGLPWAFTRSGVGLIAATMGAFFCVVGLKMRLEIRQIARDSRRLVADPTVTVSIDPRVISVSSKDSSRTMEWRQISHVREADGFLLLFTGKLVAGSFPLVAMSAQQKEFIKTQVQSSNKAIQGMVANATVPDL